MLSLLLATPYDKGAEDVPQDCHGQNEMAALVEGAEKVSLAHGREALRTMHDTAAPGAGAVLRDSGRSAAAAAAVAPDAPRAGAGSGRGTAAGCRRRPRQWLLLRLAPVLAVAAARATARRRPRP